MGNFSNICLFQLGDNKLGATGWRFCNFLSLFKPLLPVLVLIHGGAFEIGASRQFSNYTDIGNNFVRHGIVVVSIQYRHGELGFASTGDDVMPGNNGLWDQVAALKFIQKNIAKFGGDPNQITLFGQSAGSASVSILGAVPQSRDLFKRAIQMSGSSLSSWVYGSRVVKETTMLAEMLGCSLRNSTAIKRCLNGTSAEKMLSTVVEMGPTRSEPNCVIFSPRFDGDFFQKDIPELIKESPKKPTLQGFTQLESLIFTLLTGLNSTLTFQMLPWSQIDTYDGTDLLNYLNSQVAYVERFGNAQGDVARQIFNFYTNTTEAKNATFYIHQYTQIVSDLMFVMPILMEIQQKVSLKWPLYMYLSTYVSDEAFPPVVPIHESFHSNDMDYVFNNPMSSVSFDEQDLKIQAFMVEAFRNFIKTGNPSTSESIQLKWPKVSSASQLKHVDIRAPEPVIVPNMDDFLRRLDFWKQLTVKYPKYDLLREIPGRQ